MSPFLRKAMPFFICIATLTSLSISAFAQENNPLINSGEIIRQANKLHDEGKYKQSVELLKRINRSDTNYANAIYEMSFSYYADTMFKEALQYGQKGIGLFPDQFTLYSNIVASALDDMERPNEAMAYYDTALKLNPQSYLIYFNKGITYYNLKNNEEAKKNLQECLLINPFYSSAHFYLGGAYMRDGNLVASLMALKTYLLLAPDGKYSNSAVKIISNIAKGSDDVLEFLKDKKKSKIDNFDFLQEILLSKVALDKKYKLQADLEDIIVRQIQVVDEKLEYNRNDKGFAMQFYVPYYEEVFKSGDFEPMIFSMFSGLEIKNVATWNKKNKKTLDAFTTKASEYFLKIKNTRILDPLARDKATINYLYSNQQLVARGAYNNLKDMEPRGKWDLFYDNGIVKAVGNFSSEGKKEGVWNYYYSNGSVKEKINYKNGEQDGLAEGWFENGNKWYTETYRNGKVEGIQTIYFYNGNNRSITGFKDGKKSGDLKYFNIKGQTTYHFSYADDQEEGMGRAFYADGKVKNEVMYAKGKAQGTYKSYYNSGTLETKGEFINGEKNGLWIGNYEDGSIKDKTTYKENDITGEFTEYYPNGKLKEKGTYYKKKIDGKTEDYDDDGKIFSDATYEKGRLRELNFYDKSGNIVSTTTTRKGSATITFFNTDGIKISEGYFNRDGQKDGKFTEYFTSGKVKKESNWKDGVEQGLETGYFSNGKKSYERNFKDDEVEGYQKVYFSNGKLANEGWLIDGKKQQNLIYYNPLGDVTSKLFYLNDEQHGYSEYYYPNNILDYEYKHENGWLQSVTQYDTTGKLLAKSVLTQGNGKLTFKHLNGKVLVDGTYEHYLLNGPYNTFYFDGTPSVTSFYKSDERDGAFKGFFYGGAIQTEGNYKNGQKDGVWKYFYLNGKLRETEIYKNGELDGEMKDYYPDGTVQNTYTYKTGSVDGAFDMFDDKSQLAVRLNYKDGVLKSYQYQNADGSMIAPIPLKGGSGKVLSKYKNGSPGVEFHYFENSINGVRKIYYSNGKLYAEGTRENGEIVGVNKLYHPNGNIWKEENYILGNMHGLNKTYYASGKIEKEENFYNNEYHGTSKYYDEQGKLKQTKTYYYGYLTSVK